MSADVNELLRLHVTRVGFDLTLGKTHIAALVWLEDGIRNKRHASMRGHPWSHFATGARGLIERGLLIHHFNDRYRGNDPRNHLGRHYTITRAGRLVIGLLKESGVWDDYASQLPRLEAVS